MVHTLKLILAIKERPLLYDKRNNDFNNSVKKNMAWKEIANEVGGDNGTAMKEKWKNLRDTYQKHKKSKMMASATGSNKLKNWVWAKQMQFLDDYTEKLDNMNTNVATTNIESTFLDSESETEQEDYSNMVEMSNVNEATIQYDQTTECEPSVVTLDKIDYLFLSYADTLKKFSQRRQAVLKLEIAKIFAEAELQHIEENEYGTVDIFKSEH